MTITLYENTAENIRADKSAFLTAQATLSNATFRGPVNIENPDIAVECSEAIANATNYIYIQDYDRYYYVNSRRGEVNGLYIFSCSTDTRMTFLTQLEELQGIVDRQENNYDMYLPDSEIPASVKRVTTVRKIATVFGNPQGTACNIMIVAGGK